MATLKKKADRRPYDVYETPDDTIDGLLSIIPIDYKKTYLEPCRASGRIYSRLPLGSGWGEIREGVDYLTTDYNHFDMVVTNPPYSLAMEFVEKSLKDADVAIHLLRLGFLESQKRQAWLKENKPTSLIILSKRPSFTGDGKTDGAGYAWFVWDPKNKLGLDPLYFV